MRFAVRRSRQLTITLLAAFGVLIGLAMAPTLAYYATTNPHVLTEAGGATALFIGGFGAAGSQSGDKSSRNSRPRRSSQVRPGPRTRRSRD